MAVTIGSARSSYGNTTRGDQNGGSEVSTQSWYKHSKGWRCFIARDPAKRKLLGDAMLAACKNNHIGYSQPDRLALFNQVKNKGYDPARATEDTNCDCSSLVRVCCYYAGIKPSNFITSNEASALLATGEFIELVGSKYTDSSDYWSYGLIAVTKTKGHTVICVSNGSKADKTPLPDTVYRLGDRVLFNGVEGADVKELQTILIQAGYSCGDFGADSEFGDCTESAVRKLQSDKGLVVDGVAGTDTINALLNHDTKEADGSGTHVIIRGGNCYIRKEPNTNADKLGTAHAGTVYVYGGQTTVDGWMKILGSNTTGWVSGKYASLE